jgi:DNA-binding transcriptional regulator YiaG
MARRRKMDLIRAEVGGAGEVLLIRDFQPERAVDIEWQRQRVRYTREKTPAQLCAMADYLRARQAFSSDQEMAEALNVHRTRLVAWKQGLEVPNPENAQLLSHLAVVISELSEFLDPDVAGDWLLSEQQALGGQTPLQALRAGRLADVLQSANATEHGAYS